ncbi:unnamed protein product, partial [Musa acuminata subsp. burmannicoides]
FLPTKKLLTKFLFALIQNNIKTYNTCNFIISYRHEANNIAT